jgi:hypothetical protein
MALCIPDELFLHPHFFSSQNIFMPGSAVAAVAVEQVSSHQENIEIS